MKIYSPIFWPRTRVVAPLLNLPLCLAVPETSMRGGKDGAWVWSLGRAVRVRIQPYEKTMIWGTWLVIVGQEKLQLALYFNPIVKYRCSDKKIQF